MVIKGILYIGDCMKTYKNYTPTEIEMNIIVGSLLGDGSLALYGRSKNPYYREHGCVEQLSYREWKCKLLNNLDFKIRYSQMNPLLHSPSHPMYLNLYNTFYINNTKSITKENIQLLSHPIGLACLYMDDGTLVIDSSLKSNKLYIFPRIAIYTQSFTKEENEILLNHILYTFDVKFKLKTSPYGKNHHLELNKRNEVSKFINLVKPYVADLPRMEYKINLKERLEEKCTSLEKEGKNNIIISPLEINENSYSKYDEKLIIQLKNKGVSDREIAKILNRTYYGVVDKIRRLRGQGKLEKPE